MFVCQRWHIAGCFSNCAFASGLLALSACTPGSLEQRTDQPQNAADVIRSARFAAPLAPADAASQCQPAASQGVLVFWNAAAEPVPDAARTETAPARRQGRFRAEFRKQPGRQCRKVVLGDIMGVGYVIDPRVQGTISLSSGRPIAKKDMLFVLESALRANNLAMLRDSTGYRISPGERISLSAPSIAPTAPVARTRLRHDCHSPAICLRPAVANLLEGFAARPGAIRSDPSGQLLLVVGTGSERQSAVDTVRNFDVDWMRGQSVGMYPIQNSAPEPVVAELEKIMDSGDTGIGPRPGEIPGGGAAERHPGGRQQTRIAQDGVRSGSARLDSPNSASASVKVYKVRYGDAKQIAQLLNDIFVNGGSAQRHG